jgi:transposase
MEIVFRACAGLDVHQKSIVVCVRLNQPSGAVSKQRRTFGTTTGDLNNLALWLQSQGVTHVAMESTGVLWKPVWNVLETETPMTLLLVNPQHVAKVPGRKTDVSDAEWLAQLLQCGLLRGSFIPPRAIRELRDLTRSRTTLEQQRTRVVNRIHKVLEDANIKLGAVVTDITGVSGRAILQALIAGETAPGTLADLARGRLRPKRARLQEAVTGHVTDHHRFLLGRLMSQLSFLGEEIAAFDRRLRESTAPFEAELGRLDTIPGVNRRAAENLLAEIGADMTAFSAAGRLVSWAGICPGHYTSAGRQPRGTIRKGNHWLGRAIVQAAIAAVRKKKSYPQAQFRRLAARRGKQRALVAVAHSLLVAAYFILRDNVEYCDLGADHFDRLKPEALTRYFVRRLEQLGHTVSLSAAA